MFKKKRTDLTGEVFGRWTVRHRTAYRKWRCVCTCGAEKDVYDSNLLSGNSTSCGCYRSEIAKTHGMSHLREYKVWSGMVERCTNPKRNGYEHYGGRGIKVCSRWLVFENFYADMGPIPSGLTIDRIDVDGDYTPANVRLADWSTQRRNKRSTRAVVLQSLTVAELEILLALKKGITIFD